MGLIIKGTIPRVPPFSLWWWDMLLPRRGIGKHPQGIPSGLCLKLCWGKAKAKNQGKHLLPSWAGRNTESLNVQIIWNVMCIYDVYIYNMYILLTPSEILPVDTLVVVVSLSDNPTLFTGVFVSSKRWLFGISGFLPFTFSSGLQRRLDLSHIQWTFLSRPPGASDKIG